MQWYIGEDLKGVNSIILHNFARSLWLVLDNGKRRQKWKKGEQKSIRVKERDGSVMG